MVCEIFLFLALVTVGIFAVYVFTQIIMFEFDAGKRLQRIEDALEERADND